MKTIYKIALVLAVLSSATIIAVTYIEVYYWQQSVNQAEQFVNQTMHTPIQVPKVEQVNLECSVTLIEMNHYRISVTNTYNTTADNCIAIATDSIGFIHSFTLGSIESGQTVTQSFTDTYGTGRFDSNAYGYVTRYYLYYP